jgi:opacity protein-like surface antigen
MTKVAGPLLLLSCLALGAPASYAQERSIGVEAAALELTFMNMTGGIGVRGTYRTAISPGELYASATYHRFHAVGTKKPALNMLGLDASVVLFRRSPVHPYFGVGAGIMNYDADNVTTPPCNEFECDGIQYVDEVALFARATLLGVQIDLMDKLALRAATQMVFRKQHPQNGKNNQAFFLLGLDYVL